MRLERRERWSNQPLRRRRSKQSARLSVSQSVCPASLSVGLSVLLVCQSHRKDGVQELARVLMYLEILDFF